LKEEHDSDWDWLREIPEMSFKDIEVGQSVDILEINQYLMTKAFEGCASSLSLSDLHDITIKDKGKLDIEGILCDCEDYYDGDCDKEVDALLIGFGDNRSTFWVFDEMIKLHIIKK